MLGDQSSIASHLLVEGDVELGVLANVHLEHSEPFLVVEIFGHGECETLRVPLAAIATDVDGTKASQEVGSRDPEGALRSGKSLRQIEVVSFEVSLQRLVRPWIP